MWPETLKFSTPNISMILMADEYRPLGGCGLRQLISTSNQLYPGAPWAEYMDISVYRALLEALDLGRDTTVREAKDFVTTELGYRMERRSI